MKRSELLAYIVAAACVIFVGLSIFEMRRTAAHQSEVVEIEHTVEIDTISCMQPEVVTAEVVEQRAVRLPIQKNALINKVLPHYVNLSANKSAYVDTLLYNVDSFLANVDSIDVVLPIERKVYADSNYRAVVSGYDVSLDTIEVYNRHETTTYCSLVKTKPKRWGIGLVAGYGATPHGLQPFIGVAVSYTIFSF